MQRQLDATDLPVVRPTYVYRPTWYIKRDQRSKNKKSKSPTKDGLRKNVQKITLESARLKKMKRWWVSIEEELREPCVCDYRIKGIWGGGSERSCDPSWVVPLRMMMTALFVLFVQIGCSNIKQSC